MEFRLVLDENGLFEAGTMVLLAQLVALRYVLRVFLSEKPPLVLRGRYLVVDLLQLLSNVFVFVVLLVLEIVESVVVVVLDVLPRFFGVRLDFQTLRLLGRFLVTPAEGLPVLLTLQAAFLGPVPAGKWLGCWLGCWLAVELDGLGRLPPRHWRLPRGFFVPGRLAVDVRGVDGVVPLLIAGAFLAAGALLVGLLVLVAADLHLLLSKQSTT